MDEPFPSGMVECIEQFLADDGKRPSGLDVYDDVFSSPLFFPLQRQRELATMMRIARSKSPKTVFEIGADKGGGIYHWVKCLPTVEQVIACEIRGTPYASAFDDAFPTVDFLWLDKSSYAAETVSRVDSWLRGDLIDVLFIDGDKSHFLHDFYTYLPFMSPDGIVFMHDIQDEAPFAAFLDSRTHPRVAKWEMIVDVQDSAEAVAREQAGIPPTSAHESWLRHWCGASCGVGVHYLG